MARRLASGHRVSSSSRAFSSRPCIPEAALESQASPISDLWSMSGCSPATSKSNGSSNGNSPTLGNQPPGTQGSPTLGNQPPGTQGSRQFPGDAAEFFGSLNNCWEKTTVKIVGSLVPVGESSAGRSRGLADANCLEHAPKPSLQVNVGNRGDFFSVLAVVEVLTKKGIRLGKGTCQVVPLKEEGPELSYVFEVENTLNIPLSQEYIKTIMEETAAKCMPVGKWHMMYNHRMPGLTESMSRSELTTITVAGRDSLGVLCEISKKLHKAKFNIEATALRTQGPWPTARFASVFFVKPIDEGILQIDGAMDRALKSIQAELEYMRTGEELKLEVIHDERLGTPELWLNWELSRHAYPQPDMEMPKDVFIIFSSPEPSWPGWKMVLSCDDSPYVIFDILCTLYFRGYKVVQNSNFKVEGLDKRRVYMECYLQRQDPNYLYGEIDQADIKGHLALAFDRRRTENSTRFEVNATDKPGVLHQVSQLFHKSWWFITHADVEIKDRTAKTIIYAKPECPKSKKLETLEQALSLLGKDRPPCSQPIDIIR
eukprot:TRINITY_DN1985_c0_g1_i1.p1 TRINITY_DN1985_c0_g1~~TRINITY_DN1985_c0_g1_i1.p1  ORF type:complete len:542 (-),score=86.89 TRINITY_DN1985_c0_g1_i1:950-2575(-)